MVGWIQPLSPGYQGVFKSEYVNPLIDKLNNIPELFGQTWYVDGNQGNDLANGLGPNAAFRTMEKAFEKISSGDRIVFRGNIREQLTTPAGVFDVSIIGGSNNPRNADQHSGNGGYSAATWKLPAAPTALTPLLIVQQQGWTFRNFLMNGPTDAACVQLLRNAASGDSERDAGHAVFDGMRFDGGAGGLYGIQNNGGAGFCIVNNCRFYRHTAAGGGGIVCTSTSVAVPLNWIIKDNHFANNYYSMFSSLSYSAIIDNVFGRFTSGGVSMSVAANAGQGEYCFISGNKLTGAYSDAVHPAGTNNEWAGNYSVGITATNAGAVTSADPA